MWYIVDTWNIMGEIRRQLEIQVLADDFCMVQTFATIIEEKTQIDQVIEPWLVENKSRLLKKRCLR